ncbi:putative Leucine rich repeat [Trypanosoma vivax]|uniref:Putative U2 small nuclear ribonucleoprotein 40K n=1 Tax=Trypanosoma vivax (strain Y486) TaxID=1055687 RepID=G0U4H5_TRYVY|nr:putative U2 small nuclear ribonucleoprotein 40K [Trypanosoma vivax]KAH8611833.1 putative Leucine rich repeat [Trypanosoma vivax]CCC52339.1 putative U2 small nuclear ribonucleoprotein 40K [Trypanosoma vivax Y486]
MRLTLDTIRRAPQFTNTLLQRELDLRGLGITVLEEHPLLLLNNSFDVINLSQNPLVRLEYFPTGDGVTTAKGTAADHTQGMMTRLQSLIVHRSRISHVSEATCAAVLPNLRVFAADHNEFSELRDLLFISHWKCLEILSIEHNPVTVKESATRLRAFVVYLCPKLKLVNYERVTQVDRRNVEVMQEEFARLIKEWRQLDKRQQELCAGYSTGVSGTVAELSLNSGSATSKKIRKRGRQAREAAASGDTPGLESDAVPAVDNGALSAATDSGSATSATPAVDGEHTIQKRLEALEAKMAAAETEEELVEIQQEIMELEAAAKQQAESKRKRARTS